MLTAGKKFAHFEILNKLGEGGMGAVYLARDAKLNRRVALKTLTGEFFEDQNRLERFQREARTAAQISNAYVMSTYDIGSATDDESGRTINYIVLEYVEGRSLNEYLAEERLGMAQLVRLAEKIASGLAAAHKLNIVHRDIKPDNIMIDDDGDPKILDFGLAKPLDPLQFEADRDSTQTVSEELTKVGKIIGTVSYMSPEQVRGEKVDTRSDIFSFGILLYRMIAGELPFAGPSQVETMAKILESPFPSPRAKNDAIPLELERIIGKCLAKDPEDRYQTSRDLVVDLRNVRRQFDSGLTETISGTATVQRRRGLGRFWSWLAALVVVVAIVVLILEFGSSDRPQAPAGLQAKESALAILGFENKTGDSTLDWLETGLPEILLTDLSQNQEMAIISQQRILDRFDAKKKYTYTYDECVEAFFKLGEKIRIDARLVDAPTSDIVLAEKVMGDDPFALVDSITSKIAAALNLGQTSVGAGITTSPTAYKQYHLGMQEFWAGEYDTAIARFDEAIDLDSTFALPYMRIAMAHTFTGRRAEATRYFRLAGEHREGLPAKESSLLDAYVNTWVEENYDRAFGRIEDLVRDYPDDAEIRTIYALFIASFRADTAATFAQLDTVLATYPTNAFAIDNYASLALRYGDIDKAAYYTSRLIEILPDVVDPRIQLIRLRQRQNRWDEAMTLAEELHRAHPQDMRPLYRLVSLSLHTRDFAKALRYAETLRELDPDDPFNLVTCYDYLAEIDAWEGRFRASLDQRHESVTWAKATGDSTQVFVALNNLSDSYRRCELIDSMWTYEEEAYRWASGFKRISYPIRTVEVDPSRADEVRPIFKEVMDDVRARTPREFWAVADGVEASFEACAAGDTAAMIAAARAVAEAINEQAGENIFELGRMLILHGEYPEGKELLSRFVEGQYRTSDAWRFQIATYMIGRANEGLGLTRDAVESYREFLRYWGSADIQIEPIRDAQARLARLTS
jgi:tRNA A-37 threonylcarbamoyl transferase component Bud32/TolB-like protein